MADYFLPAPNSALGRANTGMMGEERGVKPTCYGYATIQYSHYLL